MKFVTATLSITLFVLACGPAGAVAQSVPAPANASSSASAPTGADGPILQKALEANAKGDCPADLMGAGLLDACHQQIAGIQPMLTAKGKITKLDFLGMQGQGEMWRVTYEHGTQIWGIYVGPDGKIDGMFTHDN
jgi:hypothetical protein